MFTGLVEGIGKVIRLTPTGEAAKILIDVGDVAEGVGKGDSVAVNGACLTATRFESKAVEFDVSAETLQVTTLREMKPGDLVNLEQSLRVGDRLGGHFVLGHVDCIGKIAALAKSSGQVTLEVNLPAEAIAQLISKGSVAVDGISLTVAKLIPPDRFSVAVIPTTMRETTLEKKSVGDRVNIELDVIGKYVARLLQAKGGAAQGGNLTLDFLTEHGF